MWVEKRSKNINKINAGFLELCKLENLSRTIWGLIPIQIKEGFWKKKSFRQLI